ncbi:Nephrin [Paragonimus heterotremus]|uniref:Nephrin n=1 Tax=Paragonimus heterotremus TaxID=100268 RepID=A0A8J4STY6_9TREM|nr:Nephrin [Paragonimus heterotremus]
MTASDESGRPLYPRATNPQLSKTSSDQTVTLDTRHNPPAITADSGLRISITCQVDMSNPKPRIHWRLHQCPTQLGSHWNGSKSQTPGESDGKKCEIIALKGIEDSSESKSVVRSHVVLTLNWSNHGDLVECFARPTAAYDIAVAESVGELSDTQGEPTQSVLTRRMLLNVRFKPVFLRPAAHLKWPIEQLQADSSAYGLPQFVAVEGGSVELDLEPLANPPIENLVWLRNDKLLNPKPVDGVKSDESRQLSVHRISVHSSTLRIQPVEIEDMGNYTLVASNNMGFTRFQFFLNVTYGPQLIGDSTINITASGQMAQLECRARANPTPTENAVRWRRLSHSFAGLESVGHFYQQSKPQDDKNRKSEMEQSQADSITGIRCNKGKWHKGFKYFAKCWSPTPGILVSSLTIYDLGPSDVGRYQCYMDNAVGSPAVRLVDLIYPFSPRVIPIPRWSKAAPGYTTRLPKRQPSVQEDMNSNLSDLYKPQARLTCVVGAEPKPSIEWTREPANLTLVEGGQFRSELKSVRPGLYHAVLYLNHPRDSDLGRYFCKATNMVGQGVGRVDLIATTRPDQPSQPRLVNATSSSLAVSWTQEFSGGPPQKFQLRWAPNDHPEDYKQVEVGEDVDSETVTYNIVGLQKATTYRIVVNSANEMFGSTPFTQYLLASTKAYDPIPDKEAMRDEASAKAHTIKGRWEVLTGLADSNTGAQNQASKGNMREDRATVIIVTASIFGAVVLIANLLVILLLAHRKRKKMVHERKPSMFAGNELVQLCPNGNSFTELNTDPRPTYAAYMDGASLSDEAIIQGRGRDQLSAFCSGFTPITGNLYASEKHNSILVGSAHSFGGSTHPSLQAINPLGMPSPGGHIDYNPMLQMPTTNLTESDLTGLTCLNRDVSPVLADFSTGLPLFHTTDLMQNNQPTSISDRRTPISIRLNTSPGHYQAAQRIESPPSGGASSISAARSTGHQATHSLERNPYMATVRPSSNHSMSTSLVRQASFNQYTPNGTFGRQQAEYIQNIGAKPTLSTFTPNQTLLNGTRMRANPMTSSYYADWGMSQLNSNHGEMMGQYDMTPVMGTCQIIRRGSYNKHNAKNHDNAGGMNSSQLLDTYLQRYNEQLQNVRTMGQLSPSRQAADFHLLNAQYRLDISHPSDGLIIPPPNAFGSNPSNQHPLQPYSPRITGYPTTTGNQPRPIYHGSDAEIMERESEIRTDSNVTSNALIKHPPLDQNLLFPVENSNNYYGCMV